MNRCSPWVADLWNPTAGPPCVRDRGGRSARTRGHTSSSMIAVITGSTSAGTNVPHPTRTAAGFGHVPGAQLVFTALISRPAPSGPWSASVSGSAAGCSAADPLLIGAIRWSRGCRSL
jgi:hypothetical protein